MNASRYGFVSAVILAGALLSAAAEPAPPESVTVAIHSGDHPDFGRVVFDTPPNVSYRVTRDGDRVTVRFSDTVKLGAAPVSPRNVLSIHSHATQVELSVVAGASLHDMRMGSRVVLDVFDPTPNRATASPAASSRPAVPVLAPPTPQASLIPPKPVAAETTAVPVAVDPPIPASQANPTPQASNRPIALAAQRAAVPLDATDAAPARRSLQVGGPSAPADIVAERGDIRLTAADIRDMLDRAEPAQRAQAQTTTAALAEFVRDRVLRQTLLAEAHAAHWDQNADVIARANDARDTVIVQTYLASRTPIDPNYPSQADITATYEGNKERFAVPKQYHVAQIVILVPTGAAKDVDEDAHRRAQDLHRKALNPGVDFAELANKNSQDRATVGRGGELGWLRDDQLVPALRDVVTHLTENAIGEPVRSAEAWHVVKLLGSRPPSVLSLDQVRDTLVQALRQTMAQQAARGYVDDLLRKEPIKLNEIDLEHRVAAAR